MNYLLVTEIFQTLFVRFLMKICTILGLALTI